MFDENFSFLSSHSNSEKLQVDDCTSSDISPFTSQTCSPRLYPSDPSFPVRSTQPLPHRDARYNYYPRHPSITALTAQLESQVLEQDASSLTTSPSTTHPSSTLSDFTDEGFEDSTSSITSSSDLESEFSSTLWELSTNITSSPRSSISLEPAAFPSFAARRRQRQGLVRLQCIAQRAPDLMMLIEECHPSSMPLSKESSWSPGSKSYSSSSLTSGRVEKDRPAAVVKKSARMRKRTTR